MPDPYVLDTCVCCFLRRTARSVSSLYDHFLTEAGVTVTQYAVLARIGRADGISVSALADNMGMDRTTLTRNLSPLEQRRLVSSKAGADRRERVLRLTPKGRDQVEKSYPLWEHAQRQMLGGLGDQRWKQLQELLAAAEDAAAR